MKSVSLCLVLAALCACNPKKAESEKRATNSTTSSVGGAVSAPSGAVASGASGSVGAPSSKAVAGVQSRIEPINPADVQRVTNPDNREPYTGPTGSVSGVVRMTGDPASPLFLAGIPLPTTPKCAKAREMYSSAYREGPGRTLADVLVAVTQYQAYLPPPKQPVPVELSGCAFNTRTIAMMYGQSLSIVAKDGEAGAPDLLGARNPALLVAVPGGDPIEVHPRGVGLDRLVDRSHEYTFVDVYVLPYPTAQVTGLDGRFEIKGIPVGSVKLNAMLPATGDTLERDVVITKDGNVDLGTLEFRFDAKKYEAAVAEQKSKIKPVDLKELADRQARARELAGDLVDAARSSAQKPSPGTPPAPIHVPVPGAATP